jgi:hypothetical protein
MGEAGHGAPSCAAFFEERLLVRVDGFSGELFRRRRSLTRRAASHRWLSRLSCGPNADAEALLVRKVLLRDLGTKRLIFILWRAAAACLVLLFRHH